MKNTNKKNILLRWFVQSLLQSLIPIVISVVLYAILLGFLNDSLRRNNESAFIGAVESIDASFSGLIDDTFNLSNNALFRKAVLTPQRLENAEVLQFQSELKRIRRAYPYVSELFIVFREDFIVGNASLLLETNNLEALDYFKIGLGMDALTDILSVRQHHNIILRQNSNINTSLLFQTVSLGASEVYFAQAIVLISNSSLVNYLSGFVWEDAVGLTLTDRHHNTFSITGSVARGSSTIVVDSDFNNFKYALVYSQAGVMSMFYISLAVIAATVVLSLAGSVAFAAHTTRQHYTPIKEINQLLDVPVHGDIDKIISKLNRLIDNNKELQQSHQKAKQSAINAFLLKLMKNQHAATPSTESELCAQYELDFSGKHIYLLALSSDEILSYAKLLDFNSFYGLQVMIYDNCQRVVDMAFCDFSDRHLIESDNVYYLVLATNKDLDAIKSAAFTYQEKINSQYKIETSVLISNGTDHVINLNTSYNEVEQLRQYLKLTNTQNEVLTYSALEEHRAQENNLAWIKPLKEYINNNYADPNLNVNMLADRFYFSLSYISRAFKRATGIGILDYIQQVRLEKARELMASGEKLATVAKKCGYTDTRSFSRILKKFDAE